MASARYSRSAAAALAGSPTAIARAAPAAAAVLAGGRSAPAAYRNAAGAVLKAPQVVAPPAVTPELLTASLSARGANAYFTGNSWTPNGKLRWSVVNQSTMARLTGNWSAEGTSAGSLYVTGLTVGQTYRAYWQLDCIPDVAGWDEAAWNDMGTQWVQPSALSAPYVFVYS